jgi:hypothetical protein
LEGEQCETFEQGCRLTTDKPYFKQTDMNQTRNWHHEVLQRLIIIFLGLLTIGAFFQV